jgi:flagellar basal body rod protein FlgG
MDPITSVAASGMRARMESLDMLANNIANTSTAGYKADREFYSLYSAAASDDGGLAPLIEKPWTDFAQGTLQLTGKPLDIALKGAGFFAVNGPSGPLYTRNGSFQVSASGEVVSAEGYPLRLTGGVPLQSQSKTPMEIDVNGIVQQDGIALGTLEIVNFPPDEITKQGISMFRALEGATAVAADGVEVQQGKLEGSNVPSAESSVRLIAIMRHFEMLQKTITIGGEMNRRALEDVARIGQ